MIMTTPNDKTMSKNNHLMGHTLPTGSKKNIAEKCVTCKKDVTIDAIEY